MKIELNSKWVNGSKTFYFTVASNNGKKMAESAENYPKRGNCLRACNKMAAAMLPGTVIIDNTKEEK